MRIVKPTDGDPQERPPLSPLAAEIFRMAATLGEPFSLQAELSVELEAVARHLFRASWILMGKPETPPFDALSVELQQRFRYLAERAIGTINPAVRLACQAEAALETDEWVNGAGRGKREAIGYDDIANFAISTYEAKLAGVRADVERDK